MSLCAYQTWARFWHRVRSPPFSSFLFRGRGGAVRSVFTGFAQPGRDLPEPKQLLYYGYEDFVVTFFMFLTTVLMRMCVCVCF